MSEKKRGLAKGIEDWTVMQYGWFLVFVLHIVFLAAGVHNLKEALQFFSPSLLSPGEQRLDMVIQAVYLVTIAFSIILLIMAVFILEIFRTQRRILRLLEESRPKDPAPSPPPSPTLRVGNPQDAGSPGPSR